MTGYYKVIDLTIVSSEVIEPFVVSRLTRSLHQMYTVECCVKYSDGINLL